VTPGPHERPAIAGRHPRLFCTPEEVEAIRAKVNAPGTLSNALWERALAAAPAEPGVPAFWTALHATAPAAALFAATPGERGRWARVAVESALAAARALDPPYPDQEEWWGRYLYRYLAFAYDAAYDAMTPPERAELTDEMERIAAALLGPERSPNNHAVVFGIDLGLLAMAMDGDVPPAPREIPDQPVVRGSGTPEGDWLPHRSCLEVERVGRGAGASDFEAGKDYALRWFRDDRAPQQQGFGIVWQQGGRAPAPGETYHVAYRFQPDIPAWKDVARATVQRNLDAVWSDGASLAGVMYGGWTLNWLVDAFEAMRRNLDVDFARHPSVRDVVRWLPTELIPTTQPFLRANNRNDSNYDQMDNRVRFGAPLAWISARYRDDPGHRDLAAAWLQSRSTAWIEWADWREAIWVRDDLLGPPPFAAPAPLDLPLSAFFRGHGLANFRTGAWDGPVPAWSLFSLVGGPFIGPEHDQTDKGSFTFYACGEDFAVDSGYAQGDPRSDATAAHNYVRIDGQGQPGPWGTTAFPRTHFLGAAMDATRVDLTRSWRNANGWGAPRDETPGLWPVRSAERIGVLLKYDGRAPVAVVADRIDRDGRPHAYEWLLHTQAGNAVTIGEEGPVIAGAAGEGRCRVLLGALAPVAWSQDTATGVELPEHPRLHALVTAPDPRFLALLVPERIDEKAPLDARPARGDGWIGAAIAHGGVEDHVVRCTADAPVRALGCDTDADLAIVRTAPDGTPTAWLAFRATVLRWGGRLLWQAEKPRGARGDACFDGTSLSVAAPDVTAFQAMARAAEFASGDVRLPGTLSGGTLAWSGRRPLRDTYPAKVAALEEDFASGCAPGFAQWPLAKPRWVRCVDGVLCLPGRSHAWISWTRRAFTPFRADVVVWPRTIFEDAVLRGTVTFVEGRPGVPWRVQARVADRTFPEDWLPPDQDLLQVELDPASGEATLASRVAGKQETLATAKLGPTRWGRPTPFEWSIEGTSLQFRWGGAVRLKATAKPGQMPGPGYFQWEQLEGLHVHLDDLRVTVDP
jgi:hypothetical protein